VIESEWKFIPWCASAEEAEILACLQGLRLLISKQCSSGVVESDCLRVFQTLRSEGDDRSPCWSLFQEGKELLKVYQHISVLKVDRVSNGAAHILAQLGKSGKSDALTGSAPACVQAAITNDCNNILV
jgi:hypothetical protein